MRFFFAIILLIFLPGFIVAFRDMAVLFLNQDSVIIPVLIALPAGFLLGRLILYRFQGVATFFHELAHAVAALMMLRRVSRFVVTRKRGGEVLHSGGFGGLLGDDFIGLAPYLLPTFTFLSILVRPFILAHWFPWYDAWIGLSFGFHLVSMMREIKLNWSKSAFYSAGSGSPTRTDIARRGFIFSLIFIATTFIAILGFLLAILNSGYPGVFEWGKLVVTKSWEVCVDLYQWIRSA